MSTLIGECLKRLSADPTNTNWVGPPGFAKTKGAALRNQLLKAKRYHFSDEAIKAAVTLAMTTPNAASTMEMARPAFDTVWIEWKSSAEADARNYDGELVVVRPDLLGALVQREAESSYRITPVYLWEDRVMSASVGIVFDVRSPVRPAVADETLPLLRSEHEYGLLRYWIRETGTRNANGVDVPLDDETTSDVMGQNLIAVRSGEVNLTNVQYLKYARHSVHPFLQDVLREARKRFAAGWTVIGSNEQEAFARGMHKDVVFAVTNDLLQHCGTLTTVIGALVLLQTKQYVTSTQVRPVGKLPRNAPARSTRVPAPEYQYVEVSVPNKVIVGAVNNQARALGVKRRQYEVGAHYVSSHKKGREDCEHRWESTAAKTWLCMGCGKKRWLRSEHIRGDARLGVVAHKPRFVKVGLDNSSP